jgi:hypothetical protein
MKSIANRLFLFAAAALSVGTVAYGQTTVIADVPFAFRAPGGVSSAGHYTVRFENNIVQLSNRETRRSTLTVGSRLSGNRTAASSPRMVFRCGAAGCQLSEIWTTNGGYSIPVHHVQEPEYTASIPLDFSRN